MTLRYYSNAPATTLSAGCTAVATNIDVASTSGLPISYPFTLILDRGTAFEEVVLCTGAAGTTLTVTRGYDSTAAFAHDNGASVEHGISAIDPREANSHINSSTGVHGRTGAVVGTTDNQTLTNKTISASSNTINGLPANNFPTTDATGQLSPTAGKAIPSGTVVGTTDVQTLTNKTVGLGNNTVTGTKAQFNAACTDADFATLDGVETLANKTLTSPQVNNGTLNSPTLNTPTLNNAVGTFGGTANGTIKPGGTTSVTAIDFGITSINTGPQGRATVPHVLGKNPAAIVATMGLNGSVQMRVSVVDLSPTNFTVEVRNASTGDLATNGTYGIHWIAIA